MPEPYATWTLAQRLNATSADHLPRRLRTAATAGDWRALYRTVRDHFVTLPNADLRFPLGAMNGALRAGTYACERSGAGTLYEQTLLLKEHLGRMGIPATIHLTDWEYGLDDFLKQMTRNTPPEYDAEWPEEARKRVKANLTQPDNITFAGPDAEMDELKERVRALVSAEEARVLKPSQGYDKGKIPLLIITPPGEAAFALPLAGPEREPREMTTEQVGEYPVATGLPGQALEVKMQVKARFRAVREERTLVDASFPADRVAGRHVEVLFDHGVPPELMGQTSIGTLTTFTPALSITRLPHDPLPADGERDAVLGEPFTIFNDEMVVEDGVVKINGVGGEPRPEIARRVTEVELAADGISFPQVNVKVWARDASGAPVPGLTGTQIIVEEEGKPVLATLRRNEVRAPRVVLLYDVTTSVPAAYRTPEYIETAHREIESAVQSVYPGATVTLRKTNDRYYGLLEDEAQNAPDLIICHSDGLIIGQYDAKKHTGLSYLPPVIFTYVNNEVHPDLMTLGGIINVTPIPADDRAALLEDVRDKLRPDTLPPYLLTYFSEATQGTEVNVQARINDQTAAGTYEALGGGTAPILEGLYLDITIGRTPSRFTLGGFDQRLKKALPEDEARAAADQAYAALLGSASVYLEGAGPTVGVMLDDLLAARLTTQAVGTQEEGADDFDAFKENMRGIVRKMPAALSLMCQLPGTVSPVGVTYPAGLRACVIQTRYDFQRGELTNRISLVPGARWQTATTDATAGFRQTFDATWELARAERAMFTTSTAALLRGRPLQNFGDIEQVRDPEAVWSGPRYQDMNRLIRNLSSGYSRAVNVVAADKPESAWFTVLPSTGSVIGMLPDLTGGGQSTKQKLNDLKKADAVLQVLINTAAASGLLPAGAFFAVVARWYVVAATHVTTLDATTESRCEMIKTIRGAVLDTLVDAIIGAYVPRPIAGIRSQINAGTGGSLNASGQLKGCAGY